MERRDFLRVLGTGGAIFLSSTFFLTPRFCFARTKKLETFSKTLPLMNTFVEITVMDISYDRACEATERAFVKIKELINIFNRFNPNSCVGLLNSVGYLNDVPGELYEVFSISKQLFEITQRGFDITVLPVLDLVSFYTKKNGSMPETKLLEEAMACVGFEYVKFDHRRIRFSRQGVMVTFDGIAKGYIIDKAAEELKNCGISYGLINAGGDLRAVGGKGEKPWIIGIQDPEEPGKIIQKVAIKDVAIATSGNYENFFDPRKIHHHIIDEKTGFSPINTISCSVIAKNAIVADGLATGFFVSQPLKVVKCSERLNGVAVEIITRGNRMFTSTNWKGFVVS